MGLESLDQEFANTKANEAKDMEEVPDGGYDVTVHTCAMKTKGGDPTALPYLALQFRVLTGPCKGRMVFKNVTFTPESMKYSKSDLALLKWTGKLSELEDVNKRMALLDKNVRINVKTRGHDEKGRAQRSVFINKALDDSAASGNSNERAARASSAGGSAAGGNRPSVERASAKISDDEPPF